jgi:hypothetical protein
MVQHPADGASPRLEEIDYEDEPGERSAIVAESTCADPVVGVLAHARVRSWPTYPEGGAARAMPLSVALTHTYATDAHVVQYAPPRGRRLSTGALEREDGGAVIGAILFDVDHAPQHAAGGSGADMDTEEWWTCECGKAAPLETFAYRTRGGYRLAFFLGAPFAVTTPADAEQWTRFYLSSVAYLRRVHGITADPVADWTRLFRLPHATRDEGGVPEDLPAVGDPFALGVWMPRITAEDIAAAATLRRRKVERRPDIERAPSNYMGRGVLFHAFLVRGWIGACLDAAEGRFAVRCPREAEHSKRSAGIDTSTVLWLPAGGDEVGWLYCAHTGSGHDRWGVRDVIGMFSPWELEQARRMAGVTDGRLAA